MTRFIAKLLFFCVPILVMNRGSAKEIEDNQGTLEILRSMTFHELPRPSTRESDRAKLGKELFFDARFSDNDRVSCATCHRPELSFTDGLTVAQGMGKTTKNTPTLVNVFSGTWFFFDGRADSLEAQVLGPIENKSEHGLNRERLATLFVKYYATEYISNFGKIPRFRNVAELKGPHKPERAEILNPTLAYYVVDTLENPFRRALLAKAKAHQMPPRRVLQTDYLAVPSAVLDASAMPAVDEIAANFGRAVAAFERTITARQSPFDRFVARVIKNADSNAKDFSLAFDDTFGAEAWRGFQIFTGRGQCVLCHAGPNLTDQQFHNVGLAQTSPPFDLGRALGVFLVRESPFNCRGKILPNPGSEGCKELPFLNDVSPENVGAFKTPTLRNIARTAPYMHDGRMNTLSQVIESYNSADRQPTFGHREETIRPLGLTDQDAKALEVFLRSLTSEVTVGI